MRHVPLRDTGQTPERTASPARRERFRALIARTAAACADTPAGQLDETLADHLESIARYFHADSCRLELLPAAPDGTGASPPVGIQQRLDCGEAIAIDDLRKETAGCDLGGSLDAGATGAALVLPIAVAGERLGALWLLAAAPREWQARDIEDGRLVANILASALGRKRAEPGRCHIQERCERPVAGAGEHLWAFDIARAEIETTSGLCELLGLDAAAGCVSAAQWESRLHPDDRGALRSTLTAHLRGATDTWEGEAQARVNTGEYRWFSFRCVALRDTTGRAHRVTGSIADVTTHRSSPPESEEHHRTLVTAMAEGIAMYDRNHRLRTCNANAARMLGLSEAQFSERRLHDPRWRAIQEDGSAYPAEHYPVARTLVTGEPLRDQLIGVYTPDGRLRWLSVNTEPACRDGEARAHAVVATYTDITERRDAELALRASEQRLRSAISHAPVMVWSIDAAGVYTFCDGRALALVGRSAQDVVGRSIFELDAGDRESVNAARRALAGEACSFLSQARGYVFECAYTPVHDGSGRVTGASGVAIDVTERQRSEEALHRSEQRATLAFHTSPDALMITRVRDGGVLEVNDGFEAVTGYSAAEALGRTTLDLGLWRYPGDRLRMMRELRDAGHLRDREMELRTKGGAYRIVTISARPIEIDGEPSLVTVTRDITSSKRAEAALRDSEARYALVVQGSTDGIWDWDIERGQIYFSPRLREILHFHRTGPNLAPSAAIQRVHPDDRKSYRAALVGHLRGEADIFRCELRVFTDDGEERWIINRGLAQRGAHGRAHRMAGSVVDITERKRIEEELERHREELEALVRERTAELEAVQRELLGNERLATIGQLAATVSHELRNPLGTIRNTFAAVSARLPAPEPGIARGLARIDRNIERCSAIVEQMLDFARTPTPRRSTIEIVPWLNAVLDELQPPAPIVFTRRLTCDSVAEIDTLRLRQAIANLVGNAVQALEAAPPRGVARITVCARCDGDWLTLEVSDNGPGIAADVQGQMFEPLVSTRAFGVGLGLALVRQTARLHGGDARYDSRPGEGARFALRLPLVAAAARPTTSSHD